MSPAQLDVLGKNHLRVGGKTFSPERKTAAVLAYLALEGPAPRSRLAGLLWPDAEEATARNNLSQLLRRLKGSTGGELVRSGDALCVTEALEVDAARLKTAAISGRAETVAGLSGELLAAHDYDDLPEFGEWLWSAREELHALRKDALEALVSNLEGQGDFRAALGYAERLVEAEPLSEAAHRHVMRLHYLLGDRPAAFRAYARLKETLKREVGVEPLPETVELARRIEQGSVRQPAVARPREIPLEVLRPPVLVGREEAWSKMDEAWGKGQFIILSGEPGIGKTRLATDFAESKGRVLSLEGRPGDVVAPLSTAVRSVRRILAYNQDTEIEPWVRRALTPLLPELAGRDAAAPGGVADQDTPLLEAVRRVLQLGSRNLGAFIYDDLQFADSASIEAGFYIISSHFPLGGPDGFPHWVCCVRPGELSSHTADILGRLVAAEQAALIELGPLSEKSIDEMLAGLDLPGKSALGARLVRLTGGNPLYVLETVRHLIETGYTDEALPGRMPPPGKVGGVIRRRLERLSPAALRIAQAAAVLQSDFDPALVGELLGLGAVALLEPWEELEKAQVLKPNRFAHDLIYEAVCQDTSPSVAALLHRRCAEVLAERGASPLRIANHYLSSGDEARAAPHLLGAAARAKDALQLAEAAERFERAGGILERGGDRAAAFDAYRQALELRLEVNLGDAELEAQLLKLRRAAGTPLMRAMVWRLAAQRGLRRGDYPGAERAARSGLDELELRGDARARTDLLASLALALARQHRTGEASEVAATLQETVRTLLEVGSDTDARWPSAQLGGVAAVLDELGLRPDALALYRRALALPSGARDRLVQLAEYGYSLLTYGDAERALEVLEDAGEQLTAVEDAAVIKTRVLTSLGVTYHHLGRSAEALRVYETSLAVSERYGHAVQGEGTRVRRARLYLSLGALQEAEADVRAAQESAAPRHIHQVYTEALLARLATRRGEPVGSFFERIERRLAEGDARLRVFVRLEQVLALPPERPELRRRFAAEIYNLSRPFALPTVDIAAHTLYAQRLLSLGRAEEACTHTAQAVTLLERYTSVYLYPLEVLLTHYRVLTLLGDPQAGTVLEGALARLNDLLPHIPEGYAERFLNHNVINREVLREAERAGLRPPEAVSILYQPTQKLDTR